jgi:hypothetical protein
MARAGGATTIDFDEESVVERLNDLTAGKGPEKCIDAVGLEAHATATMDSMYDRAKQAVMLETDRPHVLREMMYVCRPAGVLSVPGVYGGLLDKIPFGMVMNKGLTIRTGQTHVNRWTDDLLHRIEDGQNRSDLRDHAPGRAGGWPTDVRHIPRQAGRLRQSRAQAVRRDTMAFRSNGASVRALAQGLGWFSIGVGIAELAAPGSLARFLDMEGRTDLIRVYGMREIATGLRILSQDDPTPWLWGRVGGGVLDLGTLASGLKRSHQRHNVGIAIAAVAGVLALDVICAQGLRADAKARRRRPRRRLRDYSARRGMPRPPAAMRGIARDSPVSRDMRIPEAMRPYPTA